MADEFLMPKLGLTMEAGTIVNWLVEDGAEVALGQPVLVIETDKVESEVESTGAGVFHRIGAVGQEYACGAHIGWLLATGEAVPSTPGSGVGGRLLASPNARRLAGTRGIDLRTITGTGPGGRITSEDVPERQPSGNGAAGPPPASTSGPATAPGSSRGGRVLATAAARNLAELLGIDVAAVPSSGVDPRITRDDVAAHVRALLAVAGDATAAPVAAAPSAAAQEPSAVIPLRGMRGTIAERMSHSLHSMAQLTLTMDVDMGAVIADREARRQAAAGGVVVPGYTDYVIAAVATALADHPVINSQIIEDGVALLPQVNVGLAVALDDGLIVPVLHDTPSLTLEALAAETSRLAGAARSGSLTLPELEGGTFSVTALGMFDVDAFTPIINAPNTAILGVGRLRDGVAWSEDGQPARTTRLTLSLTWDHRAFDGAPAAEFTRAVKTELESVG